MTDSSDDLIGRLQAADPIDPLTLPSADDPAPQRLVDSILSRTSGESERSEAEADIAFATLPAVTLTHKRHLPGARSRGLLVSAAAAVLLLVVGLIIFSPDNTNPALAAVQNAAAATAETGSGRVATTFSLDGTDGATSERIAGEVTASFAGPDIALAVDLSDRPSDSGFDLPSSVETRLVDNQLYLNDGSQWYVVEAPAILGQTLVEFVDPRSVLTTVQELLETEEIGRATIDGAETTRYRSQVDLGDQSLGQANWLALEGLDIDAEGIVDVDLYIDSDGLLRRLDVSGDVREPDGGEGSATFEIVTSFFDLGGDITVEAPADAVGFDPTQGFELGD